MSDLSGKDIKVLREACRTDLKFLCKSILQMKDWQDGLHDELAAFLNEQGNRKLILIPRHHLKSSLVSVGWIIQQILKDFNSTILITNATLKRAEELLGQIQGYLTDRSLLPDIFGSFQNARTSWTTEKLTIAQRTSGTIKEPTISIASPTTNVTGGHYSTILNDDLVERANTSTPDQIQKVKNFYKDLVNLSPRTPIITVGTRWAIADLYGDLLSNPHHKAFVRAAVDKDGKVLFPNMVCKDRTDPKWEDKICLQAQREMLGPYEYSCQLMNNPIDDESVEFKQSWIKTYEQTPEILRQLASTHGTLSLDGATTQDKENDFTGITITKQLQDQMVYVVEALQKKLLPHDVIDLVFRLVEIHNVNKVLIDVTSSQRLWIPLFKDEMRKRGKFFQIEEIKSTNKNSKPERIRGLIKFYANGLVFHKPGLKDLEDQMIQFPRAIHDDIIDSLASLWPTWRWSNSPRPATPDQAPYWSLNWWKKQTPKTGNERFRQIFGDLIK